MITIGWRTAGTKNLAEIRCVASKTERVYVKVRYEGTRRGDGCRTVSDETSLHRFCNSLSADYRKDFECIKVVN
jgi:hypothetical protein